jgi:hypothetical protein
MLRHYVAASLSAVDRCFDGFVIAIVVGCVCLWGCLFVRKIKNVVGTSETAQNVRRHRFVFRANGGDTEEAGLAWPVSALCLNVL